MEKLFEELNISPKNKNLYITAFSHSSYANEHKAKNDYERLEFLGDAVLDLVMADYLYSNQKEKEGGKFKKAIVADIFEALIGAIYLDLGYATARKIVLNIIVPYIENPDITFFSDYKSALQENVQTEQKSLTYRLVKEEGPAHERVFTVEVEVDGIIYGVGVGQSKKEAEQEAAKEALKKLAV